MSISLAGLSFLVVDDEDSIRAILASTLRACGAEVLEATNGPQAFEMVRATRLDFVISDIKLPKGDGFTLLEQIQNMVHHRPKVILITGSIDTNAAEGIKRGAIGFLTKPFGRDRMLEVIHSHMEKVAA